MAVAATLVATDNSPEKTWSVMTGTEGADFVSGRHSVLGGRSGHDVLRADIPDAQLAGGAGFDVLLLPHGASRASTGRDGGLAWARDATTFHLGHGVSVVLGSDADDEVHIWGGTNLLLLGAGDDKLVVHRPSTVIAVGGQGNDIPCFAPGLGGEWLLTGFEERCGAEAFGAAESAEVVGVLHSETTVWARDEQVVEQPARGSLGGPCQRYDLEVWPSSLAAIRAKAPPSCGRGGTTSGQTVRASTYRASRAPYQWVPPPD